MYTKYCPKSSQLQEFNRLREFTIGASGPSWEVYEQMELELVEDPVVFHSKAHLLTELVEEIRLYVRAGTGALRGSAPSMSLPHTSTAVGCIPSTIMYLAQVWTPPTAIFFGKFGRSQFVGKWGPRHRDRGGWMAIVRVRARLRVGVGVRVRVGSRRVLGCKVDKIFLWVALVPMERQAPSARMDS